MYDKLYNKERGAIALMTVIILGVVLLSAGITAAVLGHTELILAGDIDQGTIVRELADLCIEEANFRLKLDNAYAGGTIPINTDTCVVTISGSGTSRTISSTATRGDYSRTISATAIRKQNAAGNAEAWTIDAWFEQ